VALHIDHNALTTTTSLSYMHRPTSACLVSLQSPSSVLQDDWASFFDLQWHQDPLASFRRQYFAILMLFTHCKRQSWMTFKWDDWIECLGMFWLSISKVGFVIFVRIFALFIRLRLTFFAHCLLVFVWQIDRLDALVHERNAIIYQPTMMLHWRWCILNSGECKMAVHHVSNK